ncbi:hypothetical protein [Vibrio sp. Y29_XK_CS5]|uniref:hypothetical protein n=1 Tax=Vibrio sp. Y29_XK_CS5 TaxID=2957762 RepID=UPI0020A49164|nr:hypothetical protein [Vibrio sp. Y29_XK_CS5]
MQGNVQKREISWAEIHELFVDISDEFGYTAEKYEDELTELVTKWEEQGFVEIYENAEDRVYGRAKDSSLAYGASPYYIGLFHVRVVDGDNDPLAVLVFDDREDENGNPVKVASLRFMLDHEDMFGSLDNGEKSDREFMRALRKRIDDFVQQGNQ